MVAKSTQSGAPRVLETDPSLAVDVPRAAKRRAPVRLYRVGDVVLFLIWMVSAASSMSKAWGSFGSADRLEAANYAMVGLVYVINAFLFVLRGPARSRNVNLRTTLIAAGGTWLVLALTWSCPISWDPDWLLIVSTLGLIAAYAFAIWGLLTLRRNFSILPEARHLVRSGPYAFVRHPLYAAYIATYVLLCLPRISLLAVIITAAGITCEVLRARNEEAALAAAFPEYTDYAATTPRFVPFLKPR